MHRMCTHTWWWLRHCARLVGAAPPHFWNRRTVFSCGWDTGGDGHRRIMAKHQFVFPG